MDDPVRQLPTWPSIICYLFFAAKAKLLFNFAKQCVLGIVCTACTVESGTVYMVTGNFFLATKRFNIFFEHFRFPNDQSNNKNVSEIRPILTKLFLEF